MHTISAVLFDLDGVLFDSEAQHHGAFQAALGSRGPSLTLQDIRSLRGVADAELCRLLAIILDLDASATDLQVAKGAHLVQIVRAAPRPTSGVPDVPRHFHEVGLRLAALSSSTPPVTREILDALGLSGVIPVIVSTDEVPRTSPSPDGHLMAARRLGVDPSACAAVEASRSGVLAARAAGMLAAAIPSPSTGHEDFAPADLVLPRLEALPKALGYS